MKGMERKGGGIGRLLLGSASGVLERQQGGRKGVEVFMEDGVGIA